MKKTSSDPSKSDKTEAPPATTEKEKAPEKTETKQEDKTQPPTPQTPKTSSWRKHEERMLEKQQQERQRQLLRQQQQEIYGYSPFKAPPYPIYDQRSQTPREYVPNMYGPSRFEVMQQENGQPVRPGTDVGMCKV